MSPGGALSYPGDHSKRASPSFCGLPGQLGALALCWRVGRVSNRPPAVRPTAIAGIPVTPSMKCVPTVLPGRLPVEEPGVESEPAHLEGALRRRDVILSLGAHVWPTYSEARHTISPTLFLPNFVLTLSSCLTIRSGTCATLAGCIELVSCLWPPTRKSCS